MTPQPAEARNEEWGDGRLVLRRPEVPDSDIATMSVLTTKNQQRALSAAVRDLIDRLRPDGPPDPRGNP